jgi:hypothetical protein
VSPAKLMKIEGLADRLPCVMRVAPTRSPGNRSRSGEPVRQRRLAETGAGDAHGAILLGQDVSREADEMPLGRIDLLRCLFSAMLNDEPMNRPTIESKLFLHLHQAIQSVPPSLGPTREPAPPRVAPDRRA